MDSVYIFTVGDYLAIDKAASGSTCIHLRCLDRPRTVTESPPNQLTRSPVTMGVMMYSRSEACDGRLKLSVSVCHNGLGRIEILRNGYSATGIGFGRMLNVTRYWVDAAAEGRRDDSVGIDEGCQSEEEYGSGEGLGEHFNNEWIKERRMAAGSARDRL
jgi:hypothetical protein